MWCDLAWRCESGSYPFSVAEVTRGGLSHRSVMWSVTWWNNFFHFMHAYHATESRSSIALGDTSVIWSFPAFVVVERISEIARAKGSPRAAGHFDIWYAGIVSKKLIVTWCRTSENEQTFSVFLTRHTHPSVKKAHNLCVMVMHIAKFLANIVSKGFEEANDAINRIFDFWPHPDWWKVGSPLKQGPR